MFSNALPSAVTLVKPHSFTVDLPKEHKEANLEFVELITAEMMCGVTSPSNIEQHQHRIDEIVASINLKYSLK